MQTNIMTQVKGISCRRLFWPMMAVFYALFVLRNVFSVEFSVSFYLIWVAVMALFFNDTEMKALIISFVPLVPGFQSKYAVLICMFFLIIKYCKYLRIPQFVFIIFFLMFWEFLHLGDAHSSIAEYLSGFAPLMCLAIIVSMPDKPEDASFYSRVLAISLVIASFILIASTVIKSDQSLLSMIQEGFRLGAVEEAEDYQITYNANGLGYLCNIAIVGLFINIYFKKAKIIDYVLIVISTVIGCLTVSRTFLLCLAGTIILYVLLQEKSASHKLKVFVIATGVLVLSIIALKIVAPNIIDNYIERFNAEDVTGGRSYLFDFYNDFITSSSTRFWYGIGVQSIDEKIWQLEGVLVDVPHNGYQQLIVVWGVFGLVLMMLFLLCLVLYARKKSHAPLMCYLPLVLLLVNIMAGQFITSGTKLLSLVYIYLLMCNGGNNKGVKPNGTEKYK